MSKAALGRLPRYFRCLRELLVEGIYRVSSAELARITHGTPAQVRADLGGIAPGQQGYGYNVKSLYAELSGVLGVGDGFTAMMIAPEGGKCGNTFPGDELFSVRGVRLLGSVCETDLDALNTFLTEKKPDIAVICPGCRNYDGICASLLAHPVQGVWNFCDRELELAGICVMNTPMGDFLLSLCYEIRNRRQI